MKADRDLTAVYLNTTYMGPTVNSGLCNAMLQIAKSEKMVDRLQLAAFAGCKTKSVEEFSLILATFRLLSILLSLYFSEVNFYYTLY